MPEHQNIEYKQSWHDDYLKTICGFANSQGGLLLIGKDDKGETIGVPEYKKLMDDLPNKIKNHLGITAEVNLRTEKSKYFIEIITPPYSVAISLRGRYYFRTGSTTAELTGSVLNEFLLRKSGRTWDDVVEDRATINDIDENSIVEYLKDAKKSGRLPDTDGLNTNELLEKLRLANGSQIKRAAIILFGKDPGKFYPNIFVKIGRFGKSDDDLKFQEVEEGNLFHNLLEVLHQLDRKFFTKPIDFEGLLRIEKGEYPAAALREMLLNALVHRSYSGAPIQIRMYDDKFSIWNEGTLPEGLTNEILKHQHPSVPRNPIIADVCFKGGYIDSWGRGTLKIISACKEANLPEPELKEMHGGFSVTLFKDIFTEDQLHKLGLNKRQIKAVRFLKEKNRITNKDYQQLNNCSRNTATNDLANLLEKGLISTSNIQGAGSYYTLK
ncbi:MAG: transcriptional regulator [Stygiobacter sp. RIFOXYA12_FULL_38_9]|nr:MAG: transcriptional regulator [Stygiobacter sp. RIFOXYA12_FULL_38_9]OGV08497.1 MAG: transcriptional regulator [Stygiobacter sp. RIFOXYB2_FULL_37_11]OGV13511.1 MAG: transcriptional regulator [Stygiobacter sp. RIFOXYA2_FULL_38_8]OGV14803.1 MAG: transcriptional regulator [Stygiobacter sp. RIFOXYC2_FULL_38_25]OGV79296.1 MAG: transcriptional regulator [Stygiobacter sp. GWF2_38_21]RJQ61061.1 MAG: transcriptional regulator [Stygiobacter sp.]